jgi:tetratricopeptide (TPR) repeat protein
MMNILKPAAFILLLSFSLSYCATNSQHAISRDREFQKMLNMQKQKADATAQEMESKKMPEMGAADHDRLGGQYERQDKHFLAVMEYQKALDMEPGRFLTRYRMAQLLLRGGLEEEALKEFEAIDAQKPETGLGALGKGMIFFRKADTEQCIKNLRQALSVNQRLWQAHMFLGMIHAREKDFDTAIAHHKEALTINPELAALHNNLGMAYFLKGEYLLSADAFLAALQLEPGSARVYNNLGLALARLGRYDEAFRAFKNGKDEAAAYNNIGFIYMAEGKHEQATQAFEKAIRLNPQYYIKAHENMERAQSIREAAR